MKRDLAQLAGCVLGTTVVAAAHAVPPHHDLRVDPFAEPQVALVPSGLPPLALPTQPSARLLMTLRRGRDASVNVGGEIVALGEQWQGYTLTQVAERGARFERGDEVLEMSLDDAPPMERAP